MNADDTPLLYRLSLASYTRYRWYLACLLWVVLRGLPHGAANPAIWLLRFFVVVGSSVTKANRAGRTVFLSHADAATVFDELEKRGFLIRKEIVLGAAQQGQPLPREISVWQLDLPAMSGEIAEFTGDSGIYTTTIKPLVKELVWGSEKWWGYLMFGLATIFMGFFFSFGELFFVWFKRGVGAIARHMLK